MDETSEDCVFTIDAKPYCKIAFEFDREPEVIIKFDAEMGLETTVKLMILSYFNCLFTLYCLVTYTFGE